MFGCAVEAIDTRDESPVSTCNACFGQQSVLQLQAALEFASNYCSCNGGGW
jgi:hypothetical protein